MQNMQRYTFYLFLYLKVFAIEEQKLNIHQVYNDSSSIICISIFISYISYFSEDEFYTHLIQTYKHTLTKRIFPKSH